MPAPHDYEAAKEEKARFEKEVDRASKRLKELRGDCSGNFGLTPDSIRMSPAFQEAKADFNFWNQCSRSFNQTFLRIYGKEYQAEIRAKRSKVYDISESA